MGISVSAGNKKLPDDYYLPLYRISPEEIFSDTIPALHINFIDPKTYDNEIGETMSGDEINMNTAKTLQPVIAKWYVAIRNLALVVFMVVLLYIGIQIIISSTAAEKAKYKERIMDWFTALVILVLMHYIMAFSLKIAEYITDMISRNNAMLIYSIEEFPIDRIEDEDTKEELKGAIDEKGTLNFQTNLMGYARLQTQLNSVDENGNEVFRWDKIGYTIIYFVLVIYTVMFLVIYLKRIIYMAFLTIMAPLVAMTYPIDKITDGKAQAFGMWFKEYIYNLLLQPFHLLLYTVLVGSVIELATDNMIYALVAIGFLLPAEKLLRRFFGFEKSSTAGTIMSGAVGGAVAMSAINKLKTLGSGKSGGKSGGKDSDGEGKDKVRTQDRSIDSDKTTDDLLAEGFGGAMPPASGGASQTIGGGASPIPSGTSTNASGGGFTAPRTTTVPSSRGATPVTSSSTRSNPLRNSLMGAYDGSNMQRRVKAISNSKAGKGARKIVGRVGKPAMAGIKTVGTGIAKGTKYAVKKAPRTIAKGYGAAALGLMGVAAGLASDDYKNVLAYGAGAGMVGSSLGNTAANLGGSAVRAGSAIRDEYRANRYDSKELKELQNKEADKMFMKDKENIKLYKEKFGKDDYKQAMEEAKQYRAYGITDNKMIIKAMKLGTKDGVLDPDRTSKERMAYAKVASSVKTDKELDEYGKRLKDNGIGDDKIRQVNKVIRMMKE